MWCWDKKKIIHIHQPKIVPDLGIYSKVVTLLIEKNIMLLSEIKNIINLKNIEVQNYSLQGRLCYGSRWCLDGKCLGRFNLWQKNGPKISPLPDCYELHKDMVNGVFDAGMLKICLKTIPHFLEFCEILSYGAHIRKKGGIHSFEVFSRKKISHKMSEGAFYHLINRRLKQRFPDITYIPHVDLMLLLSWGKNLGFLQRNRMQKRLEFNVNVFENLLQIKQLYNEFVEDRQKVEGF